MRLLTIMVQKAGALAAEDKGSSISAQQAVGEVSARQQLGFLGLDSAVNASIIGEGEREREIFRVDIS